MPLTSVPLETSLFFLLCLAVLIYLLTLLLPSQKEESLCKFCFRVLEWKVLELPEPHGPEIQTTGAYVQWFRGESPIGQKLSTKEGPLKKVVEDSVQKITKVHLDDRTGEELTCTLSACTTRPGNESLREFEPGKDGIIALPLKSHCKSTVIMPHKTVGKTTEALQKSLKEKVGSNDLKEDMKLKFFFLSKTSTMSYQQYSKEKKPTRYRLTAAIILLLVAIVYLQFQADSYDVSVEDFESNYDVLGLPAMTPYSEVRKAFRNLGKKYHPDKNPDCADCAARYVQISEAYSQITDYEKGKLKLVDPKKKR